MVMQYGHWMTNTDALGDPRSWFDSLKFIEYKRGLVVFKVQHVKLVLIVFTLAAKYNCWN